MGQLTFAQNIPYPGELAIAISEATLTVFPFNVYDSISFKTANLAYNLISVATGAGPGSTVTQRTANVSLGLYSLNGSTLSLANSVSRTISFPSLTAATSRQAGYISMSGTSATQNITPG